jgi:hypothetical protein
MLKQLAASPPRFAQEAIDTLLELVGLTDDARDDVAILSTRVKLAADGR